MIILSRVKGKGIINCAALQISFIPASWVWQIFYMVYTILSIVTESNYHHTSRRYLPFICRFFTMLSALELSRDPWNKQVKYLVSKISTNLGDMEKQQARSNQEKGIFPPPPQKKKDISLAFCTVYLWWVVVTS